MKKTLLVLILLCQTVVLCAQSNYKQGYVITLANDTVFGWIDFRTDNANSKGCRFIVEKGALPTEYLPGEIAGYRFVNEGKYYVSRDITLNDINQKVFLEYLVQGIMDLYSYYDGRLRYFFFEDESGEMTMVTRKPEVIENNKVVPDNKYQGVITYLFRDYQPVIQNNKNLNFNQKSFIGLVKKYHKEVCTTGEECIVFENRHPDNTFFTIGISAYAGVNICDYFFQSNYWGELPIKDVSPTIGVGVNLKNPIWSQSFSLQLNLSASRHDNAQTINNNWNSNPIYFYSYKADILVWDLGIKYEYPKYRLRPVAETGISLAQLLNFNKEESFFNTDTHKYPRDYSAFGWYVRLGCDYHLNTKHALLFRVGTSKINLVKTKDNVRYTDIRLGYTYTF
ncbi:MAG: outer membrane beta-barrel protein [Candidatus Symbiothrix sp.]|jgi:hypothetical protein|nr:outer membrane beta-barrel protein [Candidatus Symbiothrix sp.]